MTYPYQPGPPDPTPPPTDPPVQPYQPPSASPSPYQPPTAYLPPTEYQQQPGYQSPADYQQSGYQPPAEYQQQPGYQPPSEFQPPAEFQAPSAYQAPTYQYPPPTMYPPYGYPVTKPTEGMAIASLVVSCAAVLGMCGYGLGGIIGVVGAILGHVARGRISRNGSQGAGMALAGIIVGWVMFAITVIIIVGLIVAIANDAGS
ncbi:DUF4190 domain-containing protein [Paractinoplanes rishiriensis]|uniref:DUF4190 domain-containing protein n=1 Tax=Paractinoplanes rishiriensis TaxID=1050105 RepID=A0A919JYX1_9ACTN|nr:DUF4190 domain-containing protein [Actinoplanes rishiriensis]GIE97786.1 hypothetical protein Ari01nite_52510 [Actinoplanes rishiriensis]